MYIPEDDDTRTDEALEAMEVEETEETDEDAEEYEEEEGSEEDGDEAEDDAGDGDPEDLAEAFDRLRQVDADGPSDDVEGGDGAADDGDAEADDTLEEGDLAADAGGYEADGGPAVYPDAAQYQASQQTIVDQLNRQAVAQARRQFQKDGIREFTMNDVYERTQDGRVVYRNPDDPSRPFANRMEAQQWIDSFNKQVQAALIKTATDIRDRNAKAAMPALRLLQFAPTYDMMDEGTREIFDDLISDYEVRNRAGKVVGYSCDLDRMAIRAAKMATKYASSPTRKKSANIGKRKAKATGPALDARSHGSSKQKGKGGEPQTLEDAFRLLHQMEGR